MSRCRSSVRQNDRRALPAPVARVLASPGEPLDAAMRGRLAHSFGDVDVHARPTAAPVSDPSDASEREAEGIARRGGVATDLSRVRIHRGDDAAEAAAAVGARAFTFGEHVVVGRGAWTHHVLAHEIAHVAQQARAGTTQLQRSLVLESPTATAPNQPRGSALTNAQTVEMWLQWICPGGNFTIDAAGNAVSPIRDSYCSATPPADPNARHFSRGGMSTSCQCLCDATAPAGTVVRLSLGDTLRDPQAPRGARPMRLRGQGEGATILGAGTGADPILVGMSNREGRGVRGAGDTNPLAGAPGGRQILRDPPWLIFAHELCGHALGGPRGFGSNSHRQSPDGRTSAVDIENRIRREHSTTANDFGIRMGDQEVDQPPSPRFGAHVRMPAGRTLEQFAADLNVPRAQIFRRIFTGDGDSLSPRFPPAAGHMLFVEGTAWHEVLAGETETGVASQWGVTTAMLHAANPAVTNWTNIAGLLLLIPRRP